MTRRLPRYSTVSDSAVPWIGEIPVHWQLSAVGRLGSLFKGRGGSKQDDQVDGVLCVRYGDLYTQHDKFILHARSRVSDERALAYTPIQRGDVLFAASGELLDDIGKSAVNLLAEPAVCGGDVIVLRPREQVDPAFLGYALDATPSRNQKATMGRGFTVVHIYGSELKRLAVAVPPLSEQSSIVRFLSSVDRQISTAIRAKQALIRLLAEQRRAATEGAVLTGLRPQSRLVESPEWSWLGPIPASWEVKRAKWLYREVDERSKSGEEELLSVSHLTGITPRSEKNITMFMAASYEGHKLCRANDIVINTMWAWMGALGVARQAGLVSPAYGVYRPLSADQFDPNYADSLLRTSVYVGEYGRRSTGIRASRLRLYPDKFLSIPLVCPPIDEQREIAEYIRRATADIDQALSVAQEEISLLREYRTRLIDDVVTGKVDVRRAIAGLSNEIEMLDTPGDDVALLEYDDEGEEYEGQDQALAEDET